MAGSISLRNLSSTDYIFSHRLFKSIFCGGNISDFFWLHRSTNLLLSVLNQPLHSILFVNMDSCYLSLICMSRAIHHGNVKAQVFSSSSSTE